MTTQFANLLNTESSTDISKELYKAPSANVANFSDKQFANVFETVNKTMNKTKTQDFVKNNNEKSKSNQNNIQTNGFERGNKLDRSNQKNNIFGQKSSKDDKFSSKTTDNNPQVKVSSNDSTAVSSSEKTNQNNGVQSLQNADAANNTQNIQNVQSEKGDSQNSAQNTQYEQNAQSNSDLSTKPHDTTTLEDSGNNQNQVQTSEQNTQQLLNANMLNAQIGGQTTGEAGINAALTEGLSGEIQDNDLTVIINRDLKDDLKILAQNAASQKTENVQDTKNSENSDKSASPTDKKTFEIDLAPKTTQHEVDKNYKNNDTKSSNDLNTILKDQEDAGKTLIKASVAIEEKYSETKPLDARVKTLETEALAALQRAVREDTTVVDVQTNLSSNSNNSGSNASEQVIKFGIEGLNKADAPNTPTLGGVNGPKMETFELKTQPKELNKADILNQINNKLSDMKETGSNKVTIVLRPESLGRIQLDITSSKDGMIARMITENPQVKEMLDKNLDSLRNSLQAQGIDTKNLVIKVDEPSQNSSANNQERDQFERNNSKNSSQNNTNNEEKSGKNEHDQERNQGENPEHRHNKTQLAEEQNDIANGKVNLKI